MKILLADDDKALRRVLQFKLKQNGYDVTAVENGELALEQLEKNNFDLLLSDIKMPGLSGIELLEQARLSRPDLKVILMTAFATVSQAVQAVKLGAFDYITKPFEDDELFITIEKAVAFKKLENENKSLKVQLKGKKRSLIGLAPSFKEMMAMIEKVAATDATVLISGASGTGKELVARTLHDQSFRAEREFVAVNCAAIPRELLESELFGHVKGAFTGAIKDKKGKFELADGGTLLLDEVGDMPFELQAKLLRTLQERVVEPVGAEKPRNIDVRVIGATNTDLTKLVADGVFREDLFYRLNVIPVRVPNLTERKVDIPLLAKEFVRRSEPEHNIKLSDDLLQALVNYSWPGNIRELENLMERMVILRKSNQLTSSDLPDDFGRSNISESVAAPERVTFREAEEKLVGDALKYCGWNRTKAAAYLKIPRHVLIYRMKKYGLTEKLEN